MGEILWIDEKHVRESLPENTRGHYIPVVRKNRIETLISALSEEIQEPIPDNAMVQKPIWIAEKKGNSLDRKSVQGYYRHKTEDKG